jgi:hypothetical protein
VKVGKVITAYAGRMQTNLMAVTWARNDSGNGNNENENK